MRKVNASIIVSLFVFSLVGSSLADGGASFQFAVQPSVPVNETDPVIDSPTDISYIFGETGNVIIWIATSETPDTYTIYKDSIVNQTGNWLSGVGIEINVDGLLTNGILSGFYNFTIIVDDVAGNYVVDLIWVTVLHNNNADPKLPNNPLEVEPFDYQRLIIIVILILSIIAVASIVIKTSDK